jgi:hypothetical protein
MNAPDTRICSTCGEPVETAKAVVVEGERRSSATQYHHPRCWAPQVKAAPGVGRQPRWRR